MKNLILLIFLVTLLYSCEKEPLLEYSTYKPIESIPIAEVDLKKFPLEILWHKRINFESQKSYYSKVNEIFLNKEGLAIFYDDNKFQYLNRNNGESLTNNSVSLYYSHYLNYHDQIGGIITSNKEIISVDKNGIETQIYKAPDSIYIDSKISLHNDDLYFIDLDYFKGTCALYKLNVLTHNCELVLNLDGKKLWGEDYRATIYLPAFFKVKGKEYVINNYSKSNNHLTGTTYTTCTRISDGKVMWEKDDLFAVDQESIYVHYDDLILNGGSHICRVFMPTGKKVWEILPQSLDYFSPNDINAYGGKVNNGKLVFIFNRQLRELDLGTGQYSYIGLTLDGYYDSGITIANDIVYWSDKEDEKSYLYGMKLSNHTMVLKGLNPYHGISPFGNSPNFLTGKMQVDVEQNLGYISDGNFIYCMKLL